MKKPEVSVIVTAHDDAKTIRQCINALREQTLKNIEIIIIDDASTDETFSIIQKIAKKDSRIKCSQNKENLGVSASRNYGIKIATAPYIMFCDADDFYEPTTCEEMYAAINTNKTDLAVCELSVIYKAHREMKPSDDNYYSLKFSGKQQVRSHIIFNTDLSPTNKIFRKSIIQKYDIRFPDGYRFEDAYFCVAYFCASKTIYYLNKPLYNYVRHDGSLMSQTWSKNLENDYAIDHLYIAFLLYDFLEKNKLLERYTDLFWCFFGVFENFALCNSKTKARVKLVRAKAKEFIANHQASFAKASTAEQEHIRHLTNNGHYISTARIKMFLLKFMPTYRQSIDNVHQLRALQSRSRRLSSEIDRLLDR